MDMLHHAELIERIDEMITSLECDENKFYIVIDLAHQLRDELVQLISQDTEEDS